MQFQNKILCDQCESVFIFVSYLYSIVLRYWTHVVLKLLFFFFERIDCGIWVGPFQKENKKIQVPKLHTVGAEKKMEAPDHDERKPDVKNSRTPSSSCPLTACLRRVVLGFGSQWEDEWKKKKEEEEER